VKTLGIPAAKAIGGKIVEQLPPLQKPKNLKSRWSAVSLREASDKGRFLMGYVQTDKAQMAGLTKRVVSCFSHGTGLRPTEKAQNRAS